MAIGDQQAIRLTGALRSNSGRQFSNRTDAGRFFKGIKPAMNELSMVPDNHIKLEGAQANQMIRLIEALEENDDVQNVFSNADFDAKTLQEMAG